jgi:glycolate oxidase iron-sulfur subunit
MHLNEHEGAREDARRNIDAWWPLLEAGAEHVVITASGCGTQVVDYAHLLQDDPTTRRKSARVVLATRDVSEVITAEAEALKALLRPARSPLACRKRERLLAFHSPCSLQHGLKIRGTIEEPC